MPVPEWAGIRSVPGAGGEPLLRIHGRNETGERKIEVLKAEAFSYLAKPINHEELLLAIETINSIRRTERLGQAFKTLARISHELQTTLDSDVLPRRIVRAACELGYRRTRLRRPRAGGDVVD